MDKRLAEIMQMRAPNQSGVDMQAVARALGGNPALVATPTTYAFGMNVADAQKEAGLGQNAQEQRARQMQDMRDAAMKQDKQLFETAMQANQIYMQERNLALHEKVTQAEIEYKKALTSKNQAEIERLALENDKLENDMIRELELDHLTITGKDGKTYPLRPFLKSGSNTALEYITGNQAGGTPTDRRTAQIAQIYAKRGVNPDDAILLATSNMPQVYARIAKAVDMQKKAKKPEFGGTPNWGSKKGVDATGKEITIPVTESEWELEEFARQIDKNLGFLDQETRNLLKQWGPAAGAIGAGASQQTQDPFANIDIDALARALVPSLQ